MNNIAVGDIDALPPALRFMVVRRQVRGKAVMEKLIKCAEERDCDKCPFQAQCVRIYEQKLGHIKNWAGGVRIMRFYKQIGKG